jgi:hypothetical protein
VGTLEEHERKWESGLVCWDDYLSPGDSVPNTSRITNKTPPRNLVSCVPDSYRIPHELYVSPLR